MEGSPVSFAELLHSAEWKELLFIMQQTAALRFSLGGSSPQHCGGVSRLFRRTPSLCGVEGTPLHHAADGRSSV